MKGLIMSAPMVRALLDGRKTVTRRVIKPEPSSGVRWSQLVIGEKFGWEDGHGTRLRQPFAEGETIYVKERWQNNPDGVGATYAADHEGERPVQGWKPSLFMPEIASRIKLRITSVTAEPLHNITPADAIAEGLEQVDANNPFGPLWDCGPLEMGGYGSTNDPVEAYEYLWNRLNSTRGHPWGSNPWVWRIQFERIEATQ